MTITVSPAVTVRVTAPAVGLPAWRPAAGVRANRTTTQASQAPPEAASGGVLHGVAGINSAGWYCSGAFAQHLGNFGAVIKGGTGHSAYYGNEIYKGDIELGWSRISNPDIDLRTDPANLSHADVQGGANGAANGEHWTDGTFTTTRQNQPCAFQWYSGGGVVLPPNVGGAGASGALVTPYREAVTPNSGRGLRTHIMQLDTGIWSRYATNLFPAGPFSLIGNSSCLAEPQNKIYTLNDGLYALDLTTHAWSTVNASLSLFSCTGIGYSASYDRIFFLNVNDNAIVYHVITPAGVRTSPGTTGTGPTPTVNGLNGSSVWVESLKCFYHYQYTNAPNTLYKLSVPVDPEQPGVWTSETMSGDTVVNDVNTAQFIRMYWSERAQVLVWHGRTDTPLQVWTPR